MSESKQWLLFSEVKPLEGALVWGSDGDTVGQLFYFDECGFECPGGDEPGFSVTHWMPLDIPSPPGVKAAEAPQSAEAPRTVRVRIAVGVDHTGEYQAVAWRSSTVEADPPAALVVAHRALNGPCVHACWIEADVPLPPPPQTIRGEVVP